MFVAMRWDELKIEAEEERTLPGYRDAAVVRRFDAPEALDIRFYEVRAKSALNQVPKASRMPFRWTINPYRGCTHACTYCQPGDTPILMADGGVKPLEDVRVGDAIYGTRRVGTYRRYEVTHVLDHWRTMKSAYRVILEDGTELVASGDHRFLTGGGWKHVTGAERGALRRPHLTLNDSMLGTGRFACGPTETEDYRRGYLCGTVRGDGSVGHYSYARPGRTAGDVHRFRLALSDLEALRRSRRYLREAGIATKEFAYTASEHGGRASRAIRTQARAGVAAVEEPIEWPRQASHDWCKGFLAGIFDAEGSCSGAVRIANKDRAIIDWTTWCLRRLGFEYVEEPIPADGCAVVRLRGGLRQRLRFFHTVDPAITRKRTIEGTALESDAQLGVAEIEPLGVVMPMYDITTGTGDFIANGVVSHNCFARPTHTYLDMNAGRDFEREIVVKVNTPEVLRRELARPSWKREHVALGTNTDPYQWVEGRYKLMPGIWEAFRDFRNPCSILTKSPLLLRDLPLMKEIAAAGVPITANLSVPTLDEKAWRATEPHTPHPRKRLEAVAELNRAGIPCGILVAPLMPGVNDAPEQIEPLLKLAEEAGAVHIGGIALHLRGEVRDIWFDWLRAKRPDLVPRYEELYKRGAYAPPAERERLSRLVGQSEVQRRRYLRDRVNLARDADPPPQPAEVEQPSLF
jgi:DNA repair photolyase